MIVALVALLGATTAQAKAPANKAPANDNFSAATPIAVGQQISGSNLNATAETNEPTPLSIVQSPNCTAITDGPQCSSSVWFTFQPTQSGQYTVETCDLGTDVDTVLGIYTGADLNSLTLIDKDDDGPGGTCGGGPSGFYGSQITFNGIAGVLYHFDLNGFLADQGFFYLRVYAGAAQPRPTPDTHILRRNSFASTTIGGAGAVSGPRNSASFALQSPTAGTTFQCALDKAHFKKCGSVVSYDLAPGFSHTFQARSVVNGTVDPTPAVERFTIDAKPPNTSLASGPQGSTNDPNAQWVTAATERSTSSGFRCSLDGRSPTICGSIFKATQLCQGAHTFSSAAYDPASNLDRTPLTVSIAETGGSACAAPTITPSPASAQATAASVFFLVDPKGAGGSVHLEYGTTTAYGMTNVDANVSPNSTGAAFSLLGLAPNTTYHYRGTITTPFGSASTPDQTFTTLPLTGTLPSLSVGKPHAIGHHAARIPLTIDPAGVDTTYFAELSAKGPAIDGAPTVGALTSQFVKGTASGPQATELDLVDLPPGATIHYRILAEHIGSDNNFAVGGDTALKVPPIPRFKLRKGQVSAGKLGRGSSKLRVKIHGLPDATVIKLKLTAGSGKTSKARKRGGVDGKVSLKLHLSQGVRKALHDSGFGFARLRVTALPPGQKRSHVTVRLPLG
jgi:hypothetical protein